MPVTTSGSWLPASDDNSASGPPSSVHCHMAGPPSPPLPSSSEHAPMASIAAIIGHAKRFPMDGLIMFRPPGP